MSEKIKIKFTCGWESSEPITKRLSDQFLLGKFNDLIEFVHDDNYDVIVFNNFITETPKKNSKSCIFFHEPTWSGNHQKVFSNTEDYSLKIFGFDINRYSISNCEFIESPAKMFYGGRGPWTEGVNFWTHENLLNTLFEKSKGISSVVSSLGIDGNHGPEGCLYRQRSNLIKELTESLDFIDFYGWGVDGENVKGDLREKKDGLVDYRFSLCIENSNEKNYVSEKFFDCILTETIPIYYGCSNIRELIPENCFISLNDINDIESIKKQLYYINKNSEFLYEKIKPELLKLKNRYFEDFNPIKNILEL